MMQELKRKALALPNRPGVYLMRDRLGRVIYVGKARSLRKRVSQYFQPSRAMRWDPKTAALISSIADFETFTVRSEAEALLLEGKLIKEYRPHYNIVFKDDKRFLLVKVNLNEPYPQFKFARLKKDDGARYFGPFVRSSAVRRAMQWISRKYGVLVQGKGGAPGPKDLKYSSYVVPVRLAEMSREEYLRRVEQACEFLEGRNTAALAEVEAEMREAASLRQFEKAAELRDVLNSLRQIAEAAHQRKFVRAVALSSDPQAEMGELQRVLGLSSVPAHIEGFDISNISGTLSVAAAVCFRDGKPHKQHYRHYRIRTVEGSDDFASVAEVVGRRYRRVLDEGGSLPDLIVVDGGVGQLHAALKALGALGIENLPVIGLAKQLEEIHLPQQSEPLRLDRASAALRLIQRLRDEAHRFAHAYHEKLRRRRIQESVLDELPGLGPKRKVALLQRFGSIQRLREATVDEIASVPGVGRKLATLVKAFLAAR